MKKAILIFFAAAAVMCGQSFHVIRVNPSNAGVGEIDFLGDLSHPSGVIVVKPDSTGTVLTVAGNTAFAISDNQYLAVDASGFLRLGLTKQSGFIPRVTYGSGINFEVAQSSAADIGAGNTYTVHLAIDANTGAPTFTFNSATTGAIFSQSGAGNSISAGNSTSSPIALLNNTGAGVALSASANTGNAILAVTSSGIGVNASSNSGIGVQGTGIAPTGSATGVKGIGGGSSGIGVWALSSGAGGFGGIGLYADAPSSGGLAIHAAGGNVQIDHTLTVSGQGLFPGGLSVTGGAASFVTSGFFEFLSTSSGVIIDAPLSGVHAQNVGSGDSPTFTAVSATGSGSTFAALTVSGTAFMNGTVNLNGTVGGSHGQPIGTTDSPTFNNVTISGTCFGCPGGSITPPVTFNQTAASATLTVGNSGSGPSLVVSGSVTTAPIVTISANTTNQSALDVTANGNGSAIVGHNTSTSGYALGAFGRFGIAVSTSTTGAGIVQSGSGTAFTADSSGGGLAAEFGASGGDVKIDHNLTILGTCNICGAATPPIVYSVSSSSTILSVTNSGAGNALDLSGSPSSCCVASINSSGGTALLVYSAGGNAIYAYNGGSGTNSSILGTSNSSTGGAGVEADTVSSSGIGLLVQDAAASSTSFAAEFKAGSAICSIRPQFGPGIAGFACTSDRRLKRNIQDLQGSLPSIMALRPVTFNWKSSGWAATGFIAQEVQQIFPDLVHESGPDHLLMLSDGGLIPYLVRAIQDQQRQIEVLSRRVSSIGGKR